RYGAVAETRPDERTLGVNIREEQIDRLLREDPVQWIEQAPPPKRELLDDLRDAVHADTVQAPPYGLNGTGAVFGQWENGSPATTHDDLQGRVTLVDPMSTSDHATAVAGIMIGDGSRSAACGGTPYQWRGISTAAEIASYDWPMSTLDLRLSTADAIASYGIMASSNSWGWFVCGSLCSYYGEYDDHSKQYDRIVRGSQGAPISVVFGSGNEGDCFECEDSLPHFPYGTVSGPGATAKNTIAVGAVHVPDLTTTDFSGRGPVDDGRVKPDIVAPGCKGAVGVYVPHPPNEYSDGGCGTSYSTPAVTGALGILKQQFDQLGYSAVAPHTYKALLLATAQDLGNPGPDYVFGHGHLDIQAAVDRVTANHPGNHLIRVDSVTNGETDSYSMTIGPGAGPIRITLVWDDIKGTPGAAKQLVNDLDLLAQTPGALWHLPYVLDPDDPSSPATTGVNDIDNVEVIEVAAPEEGTWTVEVTGALVPDGSQAYTLVLPTETVCTGVQQNGQRIPRLLPPEIAPNPFNPEVLIRCTLSEAGPARLCVYDTRGRRIAVVSDGFRPAGTLEAVWRGEDEQGGAVPSGVYFARIEAAGRNATSRLVLIR
ncbi:MAG: S8 family peptidase, partial [Candidatus Eisenbacteria bacterium]